MTEKDKSVSRLASLVSTGSKMHAAYVGSHTSKILLSHNDRTLQQLDQLTLKNQDPLHLYQQFFQPLPMNGFKQGNCHFV